jgi:hypothetical protein
MTQYLLNRQGYAYGCGAEYVVLRTRYGYKSVLSYRSAGHGLPRPKSKTFRSLSVPSASRKAELYALRKIRTPLSSWKTVPKRRA